MEKITFEKNYQELLIKNFDKYSKYFEYKFKVFFELQTSVFEIANCLILELNKASLTLTNNVLERLMKLALIYNELGTEAIPIEKWNSAFEGPNQKYNSLNLSKSIALCREHKLITQRERDFLFNYVREFMRNGFSHADSDKILKDIPEIITGFYGSLTDHSTIKRVDLNQKSITPFQALQIDNFARENSSLYFEYIFGLIGKIEDRIIGAEIIE